MNNCLVSTSVPVPNGALDHVPGHGGRRCDGLADLEEVPRRSHGVAGRRERVFGCLPCALAVPESAVSPS